jgi:fumarate reductase subunit C
MSQPLSVKSRKILVIINYICLPLILALFYLGKYHGWSYPIPIGLAILLIVNIVTFRIVHLKTKLWHQFHSGDVASKLDERQIIKTLESIRASYNIFAVISLMVIFVIAWTAGQNDSMLMIVYVVLIYFAHTLPSSIMAWTEKDI